MTIISKPSPNQASRNGVPITDIVLHWMDGTLAAADATFANAAGQTSAHYGIEDTTIHQYVDDSRVAWHSGDWNENQRSIGIEHSAQPGRDASPQTIATSVALIVAKCREHGINPDHIYPHQRFFATACPGTLPVAAIVVAVRAQLGQPIPVPPTSGKAVLDMFITYTKTQHWLIVGGHAHVIATSADEVAYRGGGVPVIPLSAVELAAYGIK